MEKFNTSLLNALAKVKNIKEVESFSNGQLSSESVAVNLAAVYNQVKTLYSSSGKNIFYPLVFSYILQFTDHKNSDLQVKLILSFVDRYLFN